jgi:hypothetical protein
MNKCTLNAPCKMGCMDKKTLFSCILVPYLTTVVSFVLTHSHASYLPSNHEGPSTKYFGKVEDSHQHCPNGIIILTQKPKKNKKCSNNSSKPRVLMES